jgi:hypothetical protein
LVASRPEKNTFDTVEARIHRQLEKAECCNCLSRRHQGFQGFIATTCHIIAAALSTHCSGDFSPLKPLHTAQHITSHILIPLPSP